MLTGTVYRRSLPDTRRVYLNGRFVDDVTAVPEFAGAIDWVADTSDRFHSDVEGVSHPRTTRSPSPCR